VRKEERRGERRRASNEKSARLKALAVGRKRERLTHERIDMLQEIILSHVELVESDVDLEISFRKRHVLIHLRRRIRTKRRESVRASLLFLAKY